eukprot:COSAG02_NODE_4156_length_5698_cov_5911.583318_2_plen_142_part_00
MPGVNVVNRDIAMHTMRMSIFVVRSPKNFFSADGVFCTREKKREKTEGAKSFSPHALEIHEDTKSFSPLAWTIMDKTGDCPRSSLNLPKRSNHTHHNTRIFDYIILDTLDTLDSKVVGIDMRLKKQNSLSQHRIIECLPTV